MLHERQRITRRNRFCRRAPIHAGEMSSEVTTSQASSSGAALRKYRTLVRHATHPSALRRSPLICEFLGVDRHRLQDLSDPDLIATFATALSDALDAATPRQRDIVNRRDLNGESCDQVARELNLSIRQVIREHNSVLSILSNYEPRTRELALVTDASGAFDAQLEMCSFLEQAGSRAEAANVLEHLVTLTQDNADRVRIELQLAEMYTRAGRLSLARHRLRNAQEIAATSRETEVRRAQIDAVAARLVATSGDAKTAVALADHASLLLSSWIDISNDVGISRSLVDVQNFLTELAIGAGDIQKARSFNRRALQNGMRLGLLDTNLGNDAGAWKAIIAVFDGDVQAGHDELTRCYVRAMKTGFVRDGISLASTIAACSRRRGRPAEALRFLKPLSATARHVCVGEALGGFFLELAGASLETGRHDDAAASLNDARQATLDPWIQASALLLESELALRAADFASSLAAAETAETAFVRLGRNRLVGTSLRVQAEALVGLQQRERAIQVMEAAIAAAKQGGSQRGLRDAYNAMYLLTGQFRFKTLARKTDILIE
jgi:tetratricopeptide (TPR) repeat protein